MLREAVIPAAGRGMRLDRPNTPKPIVGVDGRPILSRLLRRLQAAGIERAHIILGYGADRVRRAIAADPALELELVFHECDRWREGLARTLLTVDGSVGERFLLAMADHVFDGGIISAAAGLEPPPRGVRMLVDPRTDLVFDLDSAVKIMTDGERVTGVSRYEQTPDAVDCGLMACTGTLFGALREAREAIDHADLFHALHLLAVRGEVLASDCGGGTWCDVDTPSDLVHAEMIMRDARRRGAVIRTPAVKPDPARKSRDLRFFSDGKETTIRIERGLVSDPVGAGLIPDSGASSPIFVFTDETVNRLYGRDFIEALTRAGYDAHLMVLPDGEESKSMANYLYLVERVLARGVDERSVFISLGGGVPCNVCGFVASTLYRGLDLVHVPTSLMAQCDAAISHKQGINGARGKNLVGSYYAPRLVAVDTDVLSTLSDELISDGMSEVVKHALGQDADYATLLTGTSRWLRDPSLLEEVVTRNIELKCLLAREDPKETRAGMVLQYGHTVGHPVEHLSGYAFSHGQSVAIGMMVAARVSRIMGGCNESVVETHEALLRKFGLPTAVPRGISTGDILSAMRFNKKYLQEGTRMALLREVGVLWSVGGDYAIPVPDEVLADAIEQSKEDVKWIAESPSSRALAAG